MIGDKWLSIRNDKKKGLSYSEIARKYNIDRRTAKKYCESNLSKTKEQLQKDLESREKLPKEESSEVLTKYKISQMQILDSY